MPAANVSLGIVTGLMRAGVSRKRSIAGKRGVTGKRFVAGHNVAAHLREGLARGSRR